MYEALAITILVSLGFFTFVGTYIRSKFREPYEKKMKVVYEEQTCRYFGRPIPVRVSIYEDFMVIKCIHAIKINFSDVVNVTYQSSLLGSTNAHIVYHDDKTNQNEIEFFHVWDADRMKSALSDERLASAAETPADAVDNVH